MIHELKNKISKNGFFKTMIHDSRFMIRPLLQVAMFFLLLTTYYSLLTFTPPVFAATGTIENAVLGTNTETYNAFKKQGYSDVAKVRHPVQIAQNIIYVASGLLGILMVSLLTYGGFKWMTAGGESKRADEAKKLIYQAVIGLIIVIAAWSLSYFIIDQIGKAVSG